MDVTSFFLQRYDVLSEFFLAGIWKTVPEDLMRQRPHPQVNSIAWNLWHIARVEDSGLNRFVVDGTQVLDEGGFSQRLNIPWRHRSTGMTFAEVDDLDQRIDLPALRDYASLVQARTRAVVQTLDPHDLDGLVDPDRLRRIVNDEGLTGQQATNLFNHYSGWNKGRCLMTFCLTHSFQHVGEIDVIASLLGVEF